MARIWFTSRFRLLTCALALGAMTGLGCLNANEAGSAKTQVQELEDTVERQARAIADKDEQLRASAERIQRLQKLEGARGIDKLVHVESVEIEGLSGGYDDDHDGIDEGVVVYLQLLDQDGDVIKATGDVRVRLSDPANPDGKQIVGEVALDAAAARPFWFGRFMTRHYTVKVPWANGAERADHPTITVTAQFTDLLTGRTFQAQTFVEVEGWASEPGETTP